MQADIFLLPDSNLFIQCKPLKDLDWSPWKNYSHVRLIVTRPAQVKIDRQKNKGSDRLGSGRGEHRVCSGKCLRPNTMTW
jgi:hypothetical protein